MIPTPTPFPAADPADILLDLESHNIEQSLASEAIQGWNTVNQTGILTSFQVITLLFIVLVGAAVIVKRLKSL
jgi:hypothetical protein